MRYLLSALRDIEISPICLCKLYTYETTPQNTISSSSIGYFTTRNSSCRKVMFSDACVIPFVHGRYIPACNRAWECGRHPPGQTGTSGQTPPRQTTPLANPSPSHKKTPTEASGTHPPVMHSCNKLLPVTSEHPLKYCRCTLV